MKKKGNTQVHLAHSKMAAQTIEIGTRVKVIEKRVVGTGIVAYMGTTTFQPGQWIGVVLDEAKGKNDGTVQGKAYFTCPHNHGIFVRRSVVQVIDDARSLTKTASLDPCPPVGYSPLETPMPSGPPTLISSGIHASEPSPGLPNPSQDNVVGSDCVEGARQDADNVVGSDCVEGARQDADNVVGSHCVEVIYARHDADRVVGSDCVDNAEKDADRANWSDCVDNPKQDADADIGLDNLEHLVKVFIDGGGQHDTGCGNDNLLFNSTDLVEVRLHRR
ncbi:CAP-Gly domain-containing linker protein 1 homolog [Dreissena polymorpha]|uniref:CAP-Gly domain-containing linker protein 1 homolog n=1 Tax=Dreissena polymorpha TaxID=45954 RepID=UPI0022651DD6|nr:CAP-Gly domain-containing linker protein 1 homolog [Dreissena polymorpha]